MVTLKYFVLFAFVGFVASQNIFATDIVGGIATTCFPCASAPVSQSYSATSCLSNDHACEVATIFAETQMTRICGGFSCNISASVETRQEEGTQGEANMDRCRPSAARSSCRRMVIGQPQASTTCPGGQGFFCTICCEGGCECGQAFGFTQRGLGAAEEGVPLSLVFGRRHFTIGPSALTMGENNTLVVLNTDGLNTRFGVGIDLSNSGGPSAPNIGIIARSLDIELPNAQPLPQVEGALTGPQEFLSFTTSGILGNQDALLQISPDVQDLHVLNFMRPLGVSRNVENPWNVTLLPASLNFDSLVVEARLSEAVVSRVEVEQIHQALAYIPEGNWVVNPFLVVSSVPWSVISFDRPVQIDLVPTANLVGGTEAEPQTVEANQLIIYPQSVTQSVQALTSISITGENIPSFVITSEDQPAVLPESLIQQNQRRQ